MQAAFGRGPAGKVSEDCLYLNVWTAAKTPGERRPVMVWLHPGGYTSGSGSSPAYDGEALARKGVVLVTINYRLGIFGFFSHPELTRESDRHASGNYALMDQVAALQWVQKNIAAFGGDSKRVTIFGDSAGAASLSNLMGSPQARGLFQRAIAESGAWMGLSIAPMRKLADAEQAGVKTAEALGAKTLAELRAKPAEEVLKAGRGGGPVIDGWFLPEDVGAIFAAGQQNDVPILVGSNKDEGTFFVQPAGAERFLEQARRRFDGLADTFLELYPAGSDEQANASQLAAFRDELGWVMRNWARLATKTGKSKAYLYYFTHEPPVSAGSPRGGRGSGATHGAEAQYVFENLLGGRPWTDLDHQLADTISSYWVNFAANGNPNGKDLPRWQAYDEKKNARPMVLGDKVELGPEPNGSQLAFYQAWYDKVTAR
jgi:para-nitrobenzyl esterase